ncbi:MAG: hypothetical protein JNK47_02380 [Mesorhizobium sp.]|nr:hypothetical protein [Mesorhizobium sp.]MBL8576047.1 hypothetical protein [Mesorhizobium sp.]
MTFRLTPALSILLLAGCASSEPQNVSYAPLAAQSSMQAATLPRPSFPAGESGPAPATFPPSPAIASRSAVTSDASLATPTVAPSVYRQATPASEADIAAGVPADATNCTTTDGVTLCDAPFDPVVDATQYSN